MLTVNKENILTDKEYNLLVQVKYIGKVNKTKSGNDWKNCVLYDTTASIYCAMWRKSMLNFVEGVWVYITNMHIEDRYGIKLNTTQFASYMLASDRSDDLDCPNLENIITRTMGSSSVQTINVVGLAGVSISLKSIEMFRVCYCQQ